MYGEGLEGGFGSSDGGETVASGGQLGRHIHGTNLRKARNCLTCGSAFTAPPSLKERLMRSVTHLDWAGSHEEFARTGDGVFMVVVHQTSEGGEGVLRTKQLKPSPPRASLGVNAEVFDCALVLHRESKLTNTILALSDEEAVNRHILQSGLGDTPRKLAMKPPVTVETQMGGHRIWIKVVATVSPKDSKSRLSV